MTLHIETIFCPSRSPRAQGSDPEQDPCHRENGPCLLGTKVIDQLKFLEMPRLICIIEQNTLTNLGWSNTSQYLYCSGNDISVSGIPWILGRTLSRVIACFFEKPATWKKIRKKRKSKRRRISRQPESKNLTPNLQNFVAEKKSKHLEKALGVGRTKLEGLWENSKLDEPVVTNYTRYQK